MDYNSPSFRRDASTEQHSLFGIIVNLYSKVAAYQKHNDTLPPGFTYVGGLLKSVFHSIFFCPQNNKFAQKYPDGESEDRGPTGTTLESLIVTEFDPPSRPETPNEINLTMFEQSLLLNKAADPSNPDRALNFMQLLYGPQGMAVRFVAFLTSHALVLYPQCIQTLRLSNLKVQAEGRGTQ